MSGFLRQLRIFLLLSGIYALFHTIVNNFPRLSNTFNAGNLHAHTTGRRTCIPQGRSFSEEEISQMSQLGKWLFSLNATSPLPKSAEREEEPYLILIWKHGPFLERRHIRRFSDHHKFSPWSGCTVNNCVLSYDSKDLAHAAAIVFHLHRMRSASDIPRRIKFDQQWIFLTDESPINTFLFRNQRLSDYNGLFNWSMSYRVDSDIPVPYGRTIRLDSKRDNDLSVKNIQNYLREVKTKLVAIMGSNCASDNARWDYVRELKSLLGDELEIYGKCLDGNATACPGHFAKDCSLLNAYKFYLAFENSNCKGYLTEKVFWHGYNKYAIPVIMGSTRNDCEQLLPPQSFLHVDDFAHPTDLSNYIKYLDRQEGEYIKYHAWREYYTVLNEHGYFGTVSRHYCRICEALHYNSRQFKVYNDIEAFWNKKQDCTVKSNLVSFDHTSKVPKD